MMVNNRAKTLPSRNPLYLSDLHFYGIFPKHITEFKSVGNSEHYFEIKCDICSSYSKGMHVRNEKMVAHNRTVRVTLDQFCDIRDIMYESGGNEPILVRSESDMVTMEYCSSFHTNMEIVVEELEDIKPESFFQRLFAIPRKMERLFTRFELLVENIRYQPRKTVVKFDRDGNRELQRKIREVLDENSSLQSKLALAGFQDSRIRNQWMQEREENHKEREADAKLIRELQLRIQTMEEGTLREAERIKAKLADEATKGQE